MENIIYDVDQKLDDVSRYLTVFHKSCSINVQKPRRYTPTRGQVEATIYNITRSCPGKGGVLVTPSNLITIVRRSTSRNTYEINKPNCEQKQCFISPQECMNAFENLPVNRKGVFTGNQTIYSSNSTRGNCLVKISTTDYAPFRTSHLETLSSFRVLVNECKEHPGVVFMNGGTAGYNGDVKISFRNWDEGKCV
ncbi:hypothetical protein PtA15_4A876 [Puccinia triticina]|nr:uncharacterized protein PtA15_4A876 [Puccinia triticina]WAQ84423.1 hypothetical protein PtA15_4A876 [Puccinia triticina]WAR55254.1 hypothetical protein PtB15_4B874 [Puccinia triticina]